MNMVTTSLCFPFAPPPPHPHNNYILSPRVHYKLPLSSSVSVVSPSKSRNDHQYSSTRVCSTPISLHNNNNQVVVVDPTEEERDEQRRRQQQQEEYLLAAGLRAELMPKHVAFIADGHSRWAEKRGLSVAHGHMAMAPAYKQLARVCCKAGIKVLTGYLSSTESWKRPKEEMDNLMNLIEEGIRSNLVESMRHGIRISIMGDRSMIPMSLQEVIAEAEEKTRANSRLHLILAINYGGQYDILQACKGLCQKAKDGVIQPEDIDEKIFGQELQTSCTEFPYPDFIIRTTMTLRLSNFLLYQSAYTELYFAKTCFPDFGEEEFIMALKSFQQRERRFGGRP